MTSVFGVYRWSADVFGENLEFGERDFFCLSCNGVYGMDICECDAGEEEFNRLKDSSQKAYWCDHHCMNIVPGQCSYCLSQKDSCVYIPIQMEYDVSDDDEMVSRHLDEMIGVGTW